MDFFSDSNRRYLLAASSFEIPIADNSLDAVIDSFSVAYWKSPEDKRKILEEYKRVLKKRGHLVIVPNNRRELNEAVEDIFHSYVKGWGLLTFHADRPLKAKKE